MSRDLLFLSSCGFLALLTACGVGTDSAGSSPHIEELPLLSVFGPNGERRGTRGRPGQGPGEFSSPTSIGLIGDTLWVRDAGRQRISWFAFDGALVHETPGLSLAVDVGVLGMALSVVIGDPLSDGFVGSDHRLAMGAGAADRPFHVPIIRFDRLGAVVDTVRWDTIDLGPTVRLGGRTRT